MSLSGSQMELYYNLRNLFLALAVILLVSTIIYGVRVHIVVMVQKCFGIEKRREIAKRRAGGYRTGNTTARMRSLQRPGGRASGSLQRTSGKGSGSMQHDSGRVSGPIQHGRENINGTVPRRSIDVSQVRTEKMPREAVQRVEDTVVLGEMSETMVLGEAPAPSVSPECQDTVVLSPAQRIVVRKERDVVVVHGDDIS